MNKQETIIRSEQAVIGCLLRDNDSFDEITELDVSAFSREDHQIIYKSIVGFLHDGKPVDLILLAEFLEVQGNLDRVGGLPYISELVQSVNTTKNIKAHANSIASASKLQQVKTLLNDLSTAVEQHQDPDEITTKAESGLFNLLENKDTEKLVHIDSAVAEAIDWADEENTGVQTGIRDIDRLISGLNKSNLIILAGRPSMGKSALSMQIAEHVANTGPVVIFSLEMSKREVATRLVNFHEYQVGRAEAVSYFHGLKLFIDDTPAITLSHIRSQCRKIKRKHGLSMIIVDYIQLMRGIGDNRTQEIGAISRGLKGIAKEFDMPVVVLSQLSRKVEERNDKRPVMSDLRDSGEIEQDADVILFVYREEVHNGNSNFKGLAEIICRKNRNGSIGDVTTTFNGSLTRFGDYDGEKVVQMRPVARDRGFY